MVDPQRILVVAGDGFSVRRLTRGSATGRRRALAFPVRGMHAIYLSASECKAVDAARGDLSRGSFVRRALLSAAGVGAAKRLHPDRGPVSPLRAGRIPYSLTPSERAAVDAARRERDLSVWARDAIRSAAGLGNTPWSPCADAVVTKGFRRWSAVDLRRALPGRNASTIYQRAKHLGLSTEPTGERLRLADAAEYAGFDARTLDRMLRRAGAPVDALAGPTVDARRVHKIVRKVDVDRVVRERVRGAA